MASAQSAQQGVWCWKESTPRSHYQTSTAHTCAAQNKHTLTTLVFTHIDMVVCKAHCESGLPFQPLCILST